jgi:hypothetical protein
MKWNDKRSRRRFTAVAVPTMIAAATIGLATPASAATRTVNQDGCSFSGYNTPVSGQELWGRTKTTNCNGVYVNLYGWDAYNYRVLSAQLITYTGRDISGYRTVGQPLQTIHHAKNAAGSWGYGFGMECC